MSEKRVKQISASEESAGLSPKKHKAEELNNKSVTNVNVSNINGKQSSNGNDANCSTHEDNEPQGFSSHPSLEQIRQMHAKFCKDRDWDQFQTPRNVLLALVGEIGELAEVFQWKNECQVGLKDWSEKDRAALEEELSDCLIYLVRLADRCSVDLPSAVLKKFEKNENKYPIDKAFGSSKKYTEYQ